MLLKTLEVKNRKKIEASLFDNAEEFKIYKLFTFEDWDNNQLPSPVKEYKDNFSEKPFNQERLLLEGNWPLFWTYSVSPSRMSSEDYDKIRKVQRDTFGMAIDFILLSRTLFFQFDLQHISHENWGIYFENEIELVQSKLSDKESFTRALRGEIDYRYMTSLMCDYVEKAVVTGLQLLKVSLLADVEVDIEDLNNDGWHGSNDPFDLGSLFQTHVNIKYLECIREMESTYLDKTSNKEYDKDVQEENRNTMIDLIDVPSYKKGIDQLVEDRAYYNEKIKEAKEDIIGKVKSKKKSVSLSEEQIEKIQAFAEQKRNVNKEPCIEILKLFEQHRERLALLPYATCLRELKKLKDFTDSGFPSDRTLTTWIRDYQIQF